MTMDSISMCSNTLYMSNMDVESSDWGGCQPQSWGNDIILTPNCQGTVIRLQKEERTYMTVEIKWDKKCLRKGDREGSQDNLMTSKWNSDEQEQGMWWDTCIIWPKLQKVYKIIMIYHYELTIFWLHLHWELHMVYEHFIVGCTSKILLLQGEYWVKCESQV